MQILKESKAELKTNISDKQDYEKEAKSMRKTIEYLETKLRKNTQCFEVKLKSLDTHSLQSEQQSTSTHWLDNKSKLEKDLMYYKQANKQLKSKLKQLVMVNNRLANKPVQDLTMIEQESRADFADIA